MKDFAQNPLVVTFSHNEKPCARLIGVTFSNIEEFSAKLLSLPLVTKGNYVASV
jgi:hypothetical protein